MWKPSLLDYGKIFGVLPSNVLNNLYPSPYPNFSKFYFKLYGFPDISSHVRFPVIIRMCNPVKSDLILDVGCGIGVYSNTIAMNTGARCVGVDLNPDNLRKARLVADALKLNSEFHLMDVTNLEFPNDQFDKVLCVEVLEHIKDDQKVITEIARVLKPNGLLVLSTPKRSWSDAVERKLFIQHKLFREARSGYELKTLQAKIKKAGLKILRIEHWHRWFIEEGCKLMEFLNYRGKVASWTLIYPALIPLELLDVLHERITHDRGWFRGHTILVKKERVN